MRKLRVKLRNAIIYPPWGPIFKNIFFQKSNFSKNMLLPHLKCQTCFEGDIWKISIRRMRDIFNQGALQVTILRKVSRWLAFSIKWVGNHLYMAKWTLIYSFSWSVTVCGALWHTVTVSDDLWQSVMLCDNCDSLWYYVKVYDALWQPVTVLLVCDRL